MNVVGISAFFHDSACCLLRDGRLVAAAEEERFSRVQHDPLRRVRIYRGGGEGLYLQASLLEDEWATRRSR